MAQAILAALNQRAEVTKWEGARVEFLEKFGIASRRRTKSAKLNRPLASMPLSATPSTASFR
jgi:hypothetical protein